MKGLVKKLSVRVEKIDAALITYYETNNKKEIRDPESGVVWQKRQGSTQVYDDEALKKLLRERDIQVALIFKRRLVEDRDDTAIYKLLQEEKLTLDDIEAVSHIQNHKPYLMGLEPKRAPETAESAEE